MCFTTRIAPKPFHVSSWLVALILMNSLFISCSGGGLSNSTSIKDTPTTVGLSYLELLTSGGTASWSEVDNISQILARDLASAPTSMSRMNALMSFLLAIPERARLEMAETAVAVLLSENLKDSASCLLGNLASTSPEDSEATEVFYRRSLEIEPRNPITIRSFGFKLQSEGRTEDALRLYDEKLRLNPNQAALHLIRASVCPHRFDSVEDSRLWYQTLRKRLADTVVLLRGLDNPHDKDLHVSLQQQPSFGWQYLGLPMAQLVELMNENILVMDPGLIKPATGLNPTECWGRQRGSVSWKGALDKEFQREADIGNDSAAGSWDSPEMRIRVGIVMERRANTSPERVFAAVVNRLDKRKFEVVVFAQDTPQAPPGAAVLAAADRVVLLPGHEGRAIVAESREAGGGKTVCPKTPNLHRSREVIQAEKLDCVIYLALGASLFQHLLSIGRLASLQLSFGLGHPITSGHHGIDFFVSSDLFEMSREAEERSEAGTSRERCPQTKATEDSKRTLSSATITSTMSGGILTKRPGGAEDCEVAADDFDGHQSTSSLSWNLTTNAAADPRSPLMYSEQVVLFDSFTGAFQPPRTPDPARVRSVRERIVSLATGVELADPSAAASVASEESFNSDGDASAAGIGAQATPLLSRSGRRQGDRSVRLYHCLQDAKKFHPAFDVAMRGVLDADPGARLLLPSTAKIHSERWTQTLGPRGTDRLLFLTEMEHPFMMEVVAACDVMLAPWGWGAGITSFEALAVGLPVVTLPTGESVLHFSMGQVALIGLEDELVAKDPRDYVSKAVRLANDRPYRDKISTHILRSHELLFGEVAAATVAKEWGDFIERGIRMACR